MTTYLGEKAVGIGTVKANMNVGKVITDEKTILGDGFTEQLAVNTLLFATSESVAASAEAVRTEFDGKLKTVEGEITSVEDRVRELTKATDGEFVDVKLDVSDLKDADTQIRAEITSVEDDVRELRKGTHDELVDIKLDVSDLKDADQNIRAEIAGIQTQVTAQIAGKQDKLTPGENITIEDGVISATGGGELPDNVVVNNAVADGGVGIGKDIDVQSGIGIGRGVKVDAKYNVVAGRAVAIGVYAEASATGGSHSDIAIGQLAKANGSMSIAIGAGGASTTAQYAIQLGYGGKNSDANTFKVGNGNGNFEIMSADGTIPAERMSATAGTTGQVLTKTDTGMEWQDATGGGGDYLPLSGGTLTGELAFNALNESSSYVPILRNSSSGVLAVSVRFDSGSYYDICKFSVAGGYVFPGNKYTTLGYQGSYWANVYTTKLNNGADIAVPTIGGTMALKEDIDAAVGDISTALTAILGE